MTKLIILFTLLIFSSCISFKELEFKGMNGYEMGKLSGSEVSFTLKPIVYNPNIYALKVKKSVLDLEVEGKNFGKIYLEKKISAKGRKMAELQVPLRIELESGAMLKAMPLMLKDSVRVVLKGHLKGGMLVFSKKFPVEFDKKISPKMLNPFKKP
ncbi:MAG: LEA type 2 family protein [Bacteroidetes bacterium]|nr:LEA type 2 family protein [Bacteroidota bacterium]